LVFRFLSSLYFLDVNSLLEEYLAKIFCRISSYFSLHCCFCFSMLFRFLVLLVWCLMLFSFSLQSTVGPLLPRLFLFTVTWRTLLICYLLWKSIFLFLSYILKQLSCFMCCCLFQGLQLYLLLFSITCSL
jgi:hypothetical protein